MEIPRIITKRVVRESKLFYAFSKSNLEANYFCGFAWALAGLKHTYFTSPTPILSLLKSVVSVALWLTLYVYIFDLSNQLYAVEEDRINKPNRPLPSGMVTFRGVRLRWMIYGGFFISMGLFNHSLIVPIIVWLMDTYMLCFTNLGSHWFFKNIIGMTVANWVFIAPTAMLAGPLPDDFHRHTFLLCVWIGLMYNSQDWRDVAGDRKGGRYTLPIAFGDVTSRWLYASLILPAGLGCIWKCGVLAMAPSLIIGLHMALAYRAICGSGRGRKYDHQTYNLTILTHLCVHTVVSYHYL